MAEVGIAEAAATLGVSIDTIRRRIKRGEMPARRTEGGKWLVQLPEPEALQAEAEGSAAVISRVAHLEALLVERERQIADLRQRLETMQTDKAGAETEKAHLRRLLENQQELTRMHLLPGPRPEPEQPAEAAEEPHREEPHRKNWLQRLFGS